jgi:DNA-directed RNA polymerase subunit RPC12/RpoP
MECPYCGSESVEKVREWDMPRMGYRVTHYACRSCGGRFNHYAGRGREFVLRVKFGRRG